MSDVEFITSCTKKLREYVIAHLDKSDPEIDFGTYVVWQVKVLQNNKCLMSTTLPDGKYYEFTYNGDTHELYMDVYVKLENRTFKVNL